MRTFLCWCGIVSTKVVNTTSIKKLFNLLNHSKLLVIDSFTLAEGTPNNVRHDVFSPCDLDGQYEIFLSYCSWYIFLNF